MFSGTIRYNLDPFNERSDNQLWLVLAQVSMKSYVSSLTLGLESHVSEYGDNFRYATWNIHERREFAKLHQAVHTENVCSHRIEANG
jgi:hypothetical protein